jgi:broad specificity phosphatase PhoE
MTEITTKVVRPLLISAPLGSRDGRPWDGRSLKEIVAEYIEEWKGRKAVEIKGDDEGEGD